MELAVYNIQGVDTGKKVTLNDEIFAIAEPSEHAVYLDVKQYMANHRQGTHKAKERSEVSGSTRKLGRQKGGGGARHGDINSPLLIGGGRVFAALTFKAQNNQIMVVEDFNFDAPKTKDFVNIAKNLKIDGVKFLLVLPGQNKNVFLSARNLPNARIMTASDINTYQVLDNKMVVVTVSSVDVLNNLK